MFYLPLWKTKTAAANKPCTNSIWKSQVQQKWRDTTNYWSYQVWKDLYRETRWTRGVNKFLKLNEFSKKALKQTTYKVRIKQRLRMSFNHGNSNQWMRLLTSGTNPSGIFPAPRENAREQETENSSAASGPWRHRNPSHSYAYEDARKHWKPVSIDQQRCKTTRGPGHTHELPKTQQVQQAGKRNE